MITEKDQKVIEYAIEKGFLDINNRDLIAHIIVPNNLRKMPDPDWIRYVSVTTDVERILSQDGYEIREKRK